MPKFEVRIGYRGATSYYSDATDRATAEAAARNRYAAGDNGDADGSEWEEITDVEVIEISDEDRA